MSEILKYIEEAEKILKKAAEERTGNADVDELLLDYLTNPAEIILGDLSLCAEESSKTGLAGRFQIAAQGMIDLLAGQGHGEVMKEVIAIRRLVPHYEINVPEKLLKLVY